MDTLPRLFFLGLIVPVAAFARLGETPKQCEVRYGPAISTNQVGEITYQMKGVRVITTLDTSNRVEKITYESVDGDFLDKERMELLRAESDEDWRHEPSGVAGLYRYSAPIAGHLAYGGRLNLVVESAVRIQRQQRERDAKAQDRLRGF